MLPAKMRPSKKKVSQTFKQGFKKIGSMGYLNFIYSNQTQFTVIVPKKIVAKAYQRNLIKRQIRAIVYQLFKKNIFPIVSIYYVTHKATFLEYKQDLTKLLTSI